MTYFVIMHDINRDRDICKQYDDGSDLLDDIEWLPDHHNLKMVFYSGKRLPIKSWEELRKHVSA